jgi:hypothetical protein
MPRSDYELARRRVKQKKGFYSHLAVYIIVNTFIIAANFIEHPFRFELGPALPWGIGLALHYLFVFGFPGSGVLTKDWEERETEKELRRLKSDKRSLSSPSHIEREDDPLELKELRKTWSDRDLV